MEKDVREQVQKFYGEIARKAGQKEYVSCCSGGNCCSSPVANAELLYDAGNLTGLPEEAVSSSLGCANPLVLAQLKEGETVLDLGSGGGLDVLAASKYVGPQGKVFGLDMTDDMLSLANQNKKRMGVVNTEFLKGYLEDIPLPDESVDVIMSNCVINLSGDKEKAFSEAYRVLRKGGRLAIADIVTLKEIPSEIRKMAEMWAGCLGGALKINTFKEMLEKTGFKDVQIDPVHIYSKAILQNLLEGHKELNELFGKLDLDAIDGAFAGAHIKAFKE